MDLKIICNQWENSGNRTGQHSLGDVGSDVTSYTLKYFKFI